MGNEVMGSSISHEAMTAFKKSFSIWMPWALYLIPLSCVGQLLTLTAFEQHKMNAAISQTSIPGSLFNVLTAILCPYIFAAVYLRAEPITTCPTLTIGGYFHWLWKIIQKYSLCLFLPFIIGLVLGILSFSMKSKLIFMLAMLAVLPFIAYIVIRLQSVGPLVLSNDNSPFKTSRDITKGNCWRLIGNSLLFSIKFFFIYLLLPAIVAIIVTAGIGFILKDSPSQTLMKNIVFSIFMGSFSVIGAAAGAVFTCVATHILYREKHLSVTPPYQ